MQSIQLDMECDMGHNTTMNVLFHLFNCCCKNYLKRNDDLYHSIADASKTETKCTDPQRNRYKKASEI